MNAAAWTSTFTVIGLLGLAALDIYRTILHSRGHSGLVTEALTRAVCDWGRDVAFRRSRLVGRYRLLNHIGPLLLPGIVATLFCKRLTKYTVDDDASWSRDMLFHSQCAFIARAKLHPPTQGAEL
jgi:hypothetical protein